MSLLSEQLVEEYYNRKQFFTIRGAKQGNNEMDILAIRHSEDVITGLHIEVQTSFRPIAPLSHNNAGAINRTDQEVQEDMSRWIDRKYRLAAKAELRSRLCPDIEWQFVFVHARIRDPRELDFLAKSNIQLLPFADIINEITQPIGEGAFVAQAGGDFSEILRYQGDILKSFL